MDMVHTMHYRSPLGGILLAEKGGALTGLWFEGQRYFPDSLWEAAQQKDCAVLKQAAGWLERYFNGEKPSYKELELAPLGSKFQRAVWDVLCGIPYGEVTTYGRIAETLAVRFGKEKMSARAVGGAVGHNPISIIIPCHRVIGADGSLRGYAGGLEKKKALLAVEGWPAGREYGG